MFKLILLSLFFITQAQAGVWYYGTGEAVNLENQIGFENAPNVKIKTDGTQPQVEMSGNTLSADPSINQSNLIAGASFESGVIGNCTNATIAQVDATDGFATANSFKMGRITISGASGFCDFAGIGSEGNGTASILMKTAIADAQVCALVDGVEQQCIEASATNIQPWKIPAILGATSNSVRVKWGASTSGTIDVDDPTTKIGGIETVGYSNYATVTLVNSGTNNINGTLRIAREGNIVTINSVGLLTFTSSVSPVSDLGVIPEWALPETNQSNSYATSASTRYDFRAFANGSIGIDASASTGNSGRVVTISYPVAPKKASAVNGTMVRSDLLAISTTTQDISTEATVTFSSTPELHNGTFSSNAFTLGQSGYYRIEFKGFAKQATANDSAFTASVFIRVNGVNEAIPCTEEMRYTISTLTGAGGSNRNSTLSCFTKKRLNAGDVISIRASASSLNFDFTDRTFMVSPAINPNGESFIGLVTQDVPYDGTEVIDNEKVDGQQVYKRCYEIASDITGTTTVDTLPANLNPVDAINYTTTQWIIHSITGSGTSAALAFIRYDRSTGILQGTTDTWKVGAGTRFCMRYLK